MAHVLPQSAPITLTAAPESRIDDDAGAPLPLWLKLVLFSVFLPEGMSFFIAGLRLTPTRLLFLVMTPIVFTRMAQKMSAGRYRFVASDLFVLLASLWMFIGPSVTFNLSDALQHSGPDVLEFLIAYMSTRVLLTESGQASSFARLLCIVISVVVVDAMLDTATGTYFTRNLVDHLTGYQKVWNVDDAFRFGLLRAAGPIEHPILFGFLSGVGLILAVAQKFNLRLVCIVLCSVGVAISFSSAPQQSTLMGLGLLIYSYQFPDFTSKWRLLMASGVVIVVLAFAATPTPFGHIFSLLTIDPQTAYYRLYIWNLVGPAILDNPLFSVLPGDYNYEGSVDSLWLVLALNYGLPCSIMVGLSMIGCCSLPTDHGRAGLSDAESRLGMALGIVMFVIIFIGFTVHFWGSVWIFVGLLIGLRAHLGELGRLMLEEEVGSANA